MKRMKTSQKWLTVAIFRKWLDSSVALWIEIAVILNWRYGMGWYGLVWYGFVGRVLFFYANLHDLGYKRKK